MQPPSLFPDRPDLTPEIAPTWTEGGDIFHITEKCNRLQAIHRNKRITGKPNRRMRQCFNCVDIILTKRTG
jgi:hypothetical protein